MTTKRPLILISACLYGETCRYDGQDVPILADLQSLEDSFDLQAICPEVAVGMPVPRPPITLVGQRDKVQLYQRESGENITRPMQKYCHDQAQKLLSAGCVGAILKARSPSCGAGNAERFISLETFKAKGRLKQGEKPSGIPWTKDIAKMNGDGFLVQALLKQEPDLLIINEEEWMEPNMRASFVAALLGEPIF
jgi:uncharacterized protein YbbK (DUF523 family)